MSASPDPQTLLDAWGVGKLLASQEPESGAVHRTLLVQTESGRYALRLYRYAEPAPIECEHRLIGLARARAVPAVAPLPLPDGRTALRHAGGFAALFPHAPGRQISANELRPADIAAMGRALARLHLALHGLAHGLVPARSFEVRREPALERIGQIIERLRTQPVLSADDQHVLTRLLGQRTYIERATPARPGPLLELPQQVIHGDFQLSNLFFSADEVVGIIDWDQPYVAARAWEVIRTLDLVFGFGGARSRMFLDAYRSVQPLSTEELDTAAIWYSHLRAHDLWLYEALYLQGDERVRRFVPPGPFVPLIERWAMSDLS